MKCLFPLLFLFLFIINTASPGCAQNIKVVALLPLTGPLAEYGVAAKNGFELAQKEHPRSFEKIEVLFEDSKYDNKTALTAYRKHLGSKQSPIFYAWGYGICQALSPIAEADKAPLMAVSAERAVSANRDYVLRFNYSHEQVSQALLDYARSKGHKRLALIKTELAYFNGVIAGMQQSLAAGESLQVEETFDISDMDFKSTIAKLRNKDFDALGVFLTGSQGVQFYRQMAQQKYKPKTFATDFFDSAALAKEAGGTMDGVVFPAQDAGKEFRERYAKIFGNDVQAAWAANSYELAMLASELFGDSNQTLSSERIIHAFKTATVGPAGAARYSYNNSTETPGFDFGVILRKIAGSQIKDAGL